MGDLAFGTPRHAQHPPAYRFLGLITSKRFLTIVQLVMRLVSVIAYVVLDVHEEEHVWRDFNASTFDERWGCRLQ